MLSGIPPASRPFGNVKVGTAAEVERRGEAQDIEKHVGILAIGLHQLEASNWHRHRGYEEDIDGSSNSSDSSRKNLSRLEVDAGDLSSLRREALLDQRCEVWAVFRLFSQDRCLHAPPLSPPSTWRSTD